MDKSVKIIVNKISINLTSKDGSDYLSLTDMAKSKNPEFPADVVKNWLKTRFTIDFMGIWERMNNPNFNMVEFDQFKNQAGVNSFVLSPEKWIKSTRAIGIRSRAGRYGGGTFAHKDIAFEFASWISAEFKLYLIKEFQRLKVEESERLILGWDVKRQLTKINYRIHTDAIKETLIPKLLSKIKIDQIYATEADVLNVALFGQTAKDWRDSNPQKVGNIRDYANVTQLVVLSNLESLNAEYIYQNIPQYDRLKKLNEIAIYQMQSLLNNKIINKLHD
ncbi:MAG: KilA-N domain-containing protein [bacterium]|nr:KilA-N domain-containing protein [bacterium]